MRYKTRGKETTRQPVWVFASISAAVVTVAVMRAEDMTVVVTWCITWRPQQRSEQVSWSSLAPRRPFCKLYEIHLKWDVFFFWNLDSFYLRLPHDYIHYHYCCLFLFFKTSDCIAICAAKWTAVVAWHQLLRYCCVSMVPDCGGTAKRQCERN